MPNFNAFFFFLQKLQNNVISQLFIKTTISFSTIIPFHGQCLTILFANIINLVFCIYSHLLHFTIIYDSIFSNKNTQIGLFLLLHEYIKQQLKIYTVVQEQFSFHQYN